MPLVRAERSRAAGDRTTARPRGDCPPDVRHFLAIRALRPGATNSKH